MASFSRAIDLSRVPEAVFPWLLEADRVPRWTSRLEAYEQLDDGPLRRGSRLRETLDLAGTKLSFELELTRYEPPSAAESRFTVRGVQVTNGYALEPTGAGTRLTQTLEAEAKSFSGRMLIPVMQPRLERKIAEDLDRLREQLDQSSLS